MGPAGYFDDGTVAARIDAVIDAVCVRLQKAVKIAEEPRRSIAGMRRGVIEDDAWVLGIADVVPESAVAMRALGDKGDIVISLWGGTGRH